MCGFVGFTSRIEQREQVLERCMNRIVHRGPDMAGSFIDEQVALGFRRLSIIDLSEAGQQPMSNSLEDGSIQIVFNGEIYNFLELRAQLQAAGHLFASATDTEVLIHGYQEWGTALLDHIRGMFAFVIYDAAANRLFAARDFFGIKPFYYTWLQDGSLLFGSEIKAFLEHPLFVREVNPDALLPYLTFQYSALPQTFFKGVFKLPQAHYLLHDLGTGEHTINRYWDCDFSEQRTPFEQCAEHLDEVIRESVEAHRIADVEVGTFLSGGIDSSYITACIMPEKSFSVGFDNKRIDETRDIDYDETTHAGELSQILGIENYRRLCTPDECFAAFDTIQYHMDEPQSNPSSVPLYFLAQLAAEQVTVVLSGEGGDEMFAGYHWYNDSARMRSYKKLPAILRRAAARVASALPEFRGRESIIRSSGRPEDFFIGQARVFDESEAKSLVQPAYRSGPTPKEVASEIYARVPHLGQLAKEQYLDLNLWQPGDILLKADKMSMAHSLELRVPFLDRQVMQTAQKLPEDYKLNGETTKYILRMAANKALPQEWVERIKVGFPVPIRYWLREQRYYDIVKEYFSSDFAAEFFDTDQLLSLLNNHFTGKALNQRKIWTVFTFLVWYKRFFITEQTAATRSAGSGS